MRQARGFTLLETVVALAILCMALMAIFNLNSTAVSMHAYTKRLTVASLLARGKMTDLEQQLYDDGFSLDDEEEDGDFSDEGWPSFKWRAKILAPKTEGLPPEQLLGALFNVPLGGLLGGGEEGGGDPLAGLGQLFGGMAGGGADGDAAAGAAGLAAAAGPMAGMMQAQMTQMVDQITKAVREVHLTVYWQDGDRLESFDLVTHVVSLGPGSDRNGTAVAGQQQGGGARWIDSVTRQPVPNPVNGKNPATGNPVIQAPQGPGGLNLPNPRNLRQNPGQILRSPLTPGRPRRLQ